MKDKDVRRLEEDKQGVFQLGVELEMQQKLSAGKVRFYFFSALHFPVQLFFSLILNFMFYSSGRQQH